MKPLTLVLCMIIGVGVTALPATAGPGGGGKAGDGAKQYTLELRRTQNLPSSAHPDAQGTLTMKVVDGSTIAHLSLRGTKPNTIYTIWIVYNVLKWPLPTSGENVPSFDARFRDGFPTEGNGVSPLARVDDAFTSGMGLDPGIVVATNDRGDGEVTAKLDYDLIHEAPVSNKDIIVQCVAGPGASLDDSCFPKRKVRVTTTWLRKFVADFPGQEATMCDNYDPINPASVLWQCIDPATVDPHTGNGVPRVHTFEFDHFRLAAHPDMLTHGFIGGNGFDHHIDMVGLRCDVRPEVGITRPEVGQPIGPAPGVRPTCPALP